MQFAKQNELYHSVNSVTKHALETIIPRDSMNSTVVITDSRPM